MPIMYVDDAVAALRMLGEAPGPLLRTVYNVAGISPRADQIADAVRAVLPDAVIEFAPDDAAQAVLDSWPVAIDESIAHQEWGWKSPDDLGTLVETFVAAVRAGQGGRT